MNILYPLQPANEAYWCEYAVHWISIKGRWALSITSEEESALANMLSSCPISIPWENSFSFSAVSHGVALLDRWKNEQ